MIECQRHLFDIPQDICYLNAAYMTPLMRSQQDVGTAAIQTGLHPWDVAPVDFFTESEGVREAAGQLVGCAADNIAIIPSASYGVAIAAKNVPLKTGQSILVLEGQFPSNVYVWQKLAEKHAGKILTVAKPENHDWTPAILEAIAQQGDQLALAALPHVHWSSGAMLDLVAISNALKAHGAALVLDVTQSLGACPLDIKAVDPDFMIAASYKWLLGPYSLGFLYVAERHHDGEPIEENWIVRDKSENFAGLVAYRSAYQNGARRYDVGERSNFILTPIMKKGIEQINQWGIENISTTLAALNTQLAEIAENNGYRPMDIDVRSPHMLGVEVGDQGANILSKLKEKGVFASVRGSMLRIAPHLWINEADIARFEQAL